MRFRWSDGSAFAVEFECNREEDFPEALTDALISYRALIDSLISCRLKAPTWRSELHVQTSGGHWLDPHITWGPGYDTKAFGHMQDGGRVHVINCTSVPPDPEDQLPKVRGTDYVLIIGPGCWHASRVWRGCIAAYKYMNGLIGFAADVADMIKAEENNKKDSHAQEDPPSAGG